ncbi:MAG: 30S ribosomal protein S2, partial [Elusimicrobiota bacterium]
RTITKPPDIMFVIDPYEEAMAIAEARKLKIPIVAVCDTNCDPDLIDHPIPGNDDAARAIKLFCQIIADAICEGRTEFEAKKAAAAAEEAEKAMATAAVEAEATQDAVQAQEAAAEAEAQAAAAPAPQAEVPKHEKEAASNEMLAKETARADHADADQPAGEVEPDSGAGEIKAKAQTG